jgi:CubicO group peptidase (beta-lactamase class C family)
MRRRDYISIIILTYLFLFAFKLPIDVVHVKSSPVTTYPTNGWMTATPEEVGMNSTQLAKTTQFIIDHEELGIDSVSVVKDGYICYEQYFEYYNYANLHLIHSTTKSVISALIGIANSTGMISNLDEPVVEIFSNRTIQNLDVRKEAMTIRHLLEMKSGLEVNDFSVPYFSGTISHSDFAFRTNTTNVFPGTWINFLYPENDFTRLMVSSDWTQFALDKPMATEPGTQWSYSDCITHLLSAIVREKTGMNTEAFARQYLFDPLNIKDYLWWVDPSGLSLGADGLWLHPNDMLKFGYLYLNNGEWNDAQIIPSKWVETSTKDHSGWGNYGYQWWIDGARNYYYASGLGGQLIFVKPDDDLVVAFTAWEGGEGLTPDIVFTSFILKALIEKDSSTPVTTTTPSSTTSIYSVSIALGMIVLLSYSLQQKRKT